MNQKVLRWNFVFQYGYILTNIFNAVLLLPLYIKNIDAATLGLWLATGNILAWITTADPGVGDVLQQKIAELRGKNDHAEIGRTLGSGFMATGIILLVAALLGSGFYFFLDSLTGKNLATYPGLQQAFVISVAATGLSLVSFGISGMNQGLLNSKQVALSSLLSNFLFLAINLILLSGGFGVMSIAWANLARAAFLTVYNTASLLALVNRQALPVAFDRLHFKRFTRIFSVTSLSKIVTRISENIDLIVLARFIPAGLITVFEINRRPVNIAQSLIGRHSVALMPLISHRKGQGNHTGIMELIGKQFTLYTYFVLLASFIFFLGYSDLITAWAGPAHYAGDGIIYILVASFFFGTIGFFMSNVGYALGDIRANSMIGITKGILAAVLSYVVAGTYGIKGVLLASLGCIVVIDVFFYAGRLYRLGYLRMDRVKGIFRLWSFVVPAGMLLAWASWSVTDYFIPSQAHLIRFVFRSGLFTTFFIAVILLFDYELRAFIMKSRNKPAMNSVVSG